jgi:hypothetical protein
VPAGVTSGSRLERIFARVVALRAPILLVFALLVPAAVVLAMRIPSEGAISGPEHIRAELGEILTGAHQGRTSPDELTVFKSLGLAVEDLAAAALVYERAKARGAGHWVEF